MNSKTGRLDDDLEQQKPSVEQSVVLQNTSDAQQMVHSRVMTYDTMSTSTQPQNFVLQDYGCQQLHQILNPTSQYQMQQQVTTHPDCQQSPQRANDGNHGTFLNSDTIYAPEQPQNIQHLQRPQTEQPQQYHEHALDLQCQQNAQRQQQVQHQQYQQNKQHQQYQQHHQYQQYQQYQQRLQDKPHVGNVTYGGGTIAISKPFTHNTDNTEIDLYGDYVMKNDSQKFSVSEVEFPNLVGNELCTNDPTIQMKCFDKNSFESMTNAMIRSDNSELAEAMNVSQPTEAFCLPDTSPFAGESNFEISFPANSSKFQSESAEPGADDVTEIFVKKKYLIQFQIFHELHRELFVRLAVFHREALKLAQPVRPCRQHLEDSRPEHVIEVPPQLNPRYQNDQGHSYVVVQPNKNIPCAAASQPNYQGSVQMQFLCWNSCYLERWILVCELLNSASHVFGRKKFYVKVCALPTRESKGKISPGLKRKKDGVKCPKVKQETEPVKPTSTSNDIQSAANDSGAFQPTFASNSKFWPELHQQVNSDSEQTNSTEKRLGGHTTKITWQGELPTYEQSDFPTVFPQNSEHEVTENFQLFEQMISSNLSVGHDITGVIDQTVKRPSFHSSEKSATLAKRPRTTSNAQDIEHMQFPADEVSEARSGEANKGQPLYPAAGLLTSSANTNAASRLPQGLPQEHLEYVPGSASGVGGEEVRAPYPGVHEVYRLMHDREIKTFLKLKFIEGTLREKYPDILQELETKFEELMSDLTKFQ